MNKKQSTAFLAECKDRMSPDAYSKLYECFTRHANTATTKGPSPYKVRNSRSPALVSLFQWEGIKNCQLNHRMMLDWVKKHELCPVLVQEAIEEFRVEMISKNKLYADFRAAFQTYVNKGYLSKKMGNLRLSNSPHKNASHTQVFDRGVRI